MPFGSNEQMDVTTLVRIATAALLSATMIACASERPVVSDGDVTLQPDDSSELASDSDGSCSVGETRDCKIQWTDDTGAVNCIVTKQACKADGSGWLECGKSQ